MFKIPPEITQPGVRFESGLCRNRSCGSTVRITQHQQKDGKLSSQCVACREARRIRKW